MDSLLTPLISSTTRTRLLLRFFSNPGISSYLRALAGELNTSTNTVREELNRLTQAQLLKAHKNGREVRYQANDQHPLFAELMSIAKKVLGIDRVIEDIIEQLGDLRLAMIVDDYAEGRDTGIIDLVLVGSIDQKLLAGLVAKTEGYIKRKIRTLCLTWQEYENLSTTLAKRPCLILWEQGAAVAKQRRLG